MLSGVFSIAVPAQNSAPPSEFRGTDGPALVPREFLGGPENALAHEAADALLAGETACNPLVLFGPRGGGKSLLARTLAQRWKVEHAGRKSLVVRGADFARSVANAVETNALDDLRARYKAAHLLVLDELQELASRRRAQQELAGVIDSLVRGRRPVVVTASAPPAEIPELEASLVSRLCGGLTVPLALPGRECRRELWQRSLARRGLTTSEEALDRLASTLNLSAPELDACAHELAERCSVTKRVDVEVAQAFVAKRAARSRPSLRAIAAYVARHFGLRTDDLTGRARHRTVATARCTAIYLSRRLTSHSLEAVGRYYGGRDHSTVLHACRKAEVMLKEDREFRAAVSELSSRIDAKAQPAGAD